MLLRDLLRRRSAEHRTASLSYSQEHLWFLNQLHENNPFYNTVLAIRLRGVLEIAVLQRMLKLLAERHEALRTAFRVDDGRPVLVIAERIDVPLPLVELSNARASERESRLKDLTLEEGRKPFNLERDSLIRARLFRLASEDHVLVVTLHHIVTDGWSIDVLLRDAKEIYEALMAGCKPQLPALTLQYSDFSSWQRNALTSRIDEQVGYWRSMLADAPEVLAMPTDYQRPAVQTFRGSVRRFNVDRETAEQVSDFCNRTGSTMFVALLAAFAGLLYRYTQQEDMIIGAPVANRGHVELENLVGYFVNTIPLRFRANGDCTYRQLVQQVRQVTLDGLSHQDVPLKRIVDELGPDRTLSRNPLFQVTFQMRSSNMREQKWANLSAEFMDVDIGIAQFDLSLDIQHAWTGLVGRIQYCTDLFQDETIERLATHFTVLLRDAVSSPDRRLADLRLLTQVELRDLLPSEHEERLTTPFVHESISAQAWRCPAATAVECDESSITYAELESRSNRLANDLLNSGLLQDDVVGLNFKRSIEMIVAVLGVLKAGCTYLPIDPDYPHLRKRLILNDAKVRRIITTEDLLPGLPHDCPPVACVRNNAAATDNLETHSPQVKSHPSGGAYILYTSGSLGRPRGVVATHQSLASHSHAVRGRYGLTQTDRVLQFAPFGFDVFAEEVFPTLATGACVVLTKETPSPQFLTELLRRTQVSVVNIPSSYWQHWLETEPNPPENLRLLIIGSERASSEAIKKWKERFEKMPLINAYGCTESTITSITTVPRAEGASIDSAGDIGIPLGGVSAIVLDRHLNAVPYGVPGELYVAGWGMARGYCGDPTATAQLFVPNPYANGRGQRMFRTGDVAVRRSSGNFILLGRADEQIKVNGVRAEPAEVEEALVTHPLVKEAAVTATAMQHGELPRLAAFVTLRAEGTDRVATVERERVADWRAVHDDEYFNEMQAPLTDFNISGWVNSFDGAPIPDQEMREWVDGTVSRIVNPRPDRVLEIGCGTGLLSARLVPHCVEYVGTDVSSVAIDYSSRLLSKRENIGHSQVHFLRQEASDFTGIPANYFDVVILNSVVQYFPSAKYLSDVLKQAIDRLRAGGRLFVGDVRDLALLSAFHAAIEEYRAGGETLASNLRALVSDRVARETELCVSPDFFVRFARTNTQAKAIAFMLKPGRFHNELTKFRYDVLVTNEKFDTDKYMDTFARVSGSELKLDSLRTLLSDTGTCSLRVERIDNRRLDREIALLDWMMDGTSDVRLEDFRARWRHRDSLDPCSVLRVAEERGFAAAIAPAASRVPSEFDAVFRRMSSKQPERDPIPWVDLTHFKSTVDPNFEYTNTPLRAALERQLIPELRQHLGERLPHQLIPSAIVILDALPKLQNGKIAKSLLPVSVALKQAPSRSGPMNDLERSLARLWAEVLGVDHVGVDDNFFQLGGDSILVIQVASRAASEKIRFSVRDVFESQTIRRLARLITEQETSSSSSAVVTKRTNHQAGPPPILRWFLEQDLAKPSHYNQVLGLELQGVPTNLLISAMQQTLEQHEVFRLRLRDGTLKLEAVGTLCEYQEIDLSSLAEEEQRRRLSAMVARMQIGLSLESGPLVGLVAARRNDHDSLAVVVAHHVTVDAVSWQVIVADLVQAIRIASGESKQDALVTRASYRDWVDSLDAFAQTDACLKELNRWLSLPWPDLGSNDFATNGAGNTEGSAQRFHAVLSQDETRVVVLAAKRLRSSVEELVLAGVLTALPMSARNDGIVIDMEWHGRQVTSGLPEGGDIVGWLSSLYPVPFKAPGRCGILDTLRVVKDSLRRVPTRGFSFGLLRYLNNDPKVRQRLAALPKPRVNFNFLGRLDPQVSMPGVRVLSGEWGPSRAPENRRPYDIEVNSGIIHGELFIDWIDDSRESMAALNPAAQVLDQLRLATSATNHETSHLHVCDYELAALHPKELNSLLATHGELEDIFPVTAQQATMLIHALMYPDSRVGREQTVWLIRGQLDVDRFLQGWQKLVDRHPSLRTAFDWKTCSKPIQLVYPVARVASHMVDLSTMHSDSRNAELKSLLARDLDRGFGLDHAPLMRIYMVKLTDATRAFVLSHHHLILDGWSVSLLINEALRIYEGNDSRDDDDLSVTPYRDYFSWLGAHNQANAVARWADYLRDAEPCILTNLDTAALPSLTQATPSRECLTLGDDVLTGLGHQARRYGVTTAAIVQGALALSLTFTSGSTSATFGMTVSGRSAGMGSAERLVGLFTNVVPCSWRIPRAGNVSTLIRSNFNAWSSVADLGHLPLKQLQDLMANGHKTRAFDCLLVVQNYPRPRTGRQSPSLEVEHLYSTLRTGFPVTLVVELKDRIQVSAIFQPSLISTERIGLLVALLAETLTTFSSGLDADINDLMLILERTRERHRAIPRQRQ